MSEYAVALAVVFVVNLLPAFGPPTWSLLVLFTLNFNLDPAAVVIGGALAAAGGRLLLASGARRLRPRFSTDRLASLAAVEHTLTRGRGRAIVGLGLFALSPLPSAQLFVAAGLLDLRLLPLTAAFFAGRLVSYTLYVGAATAVGATVGEVVGDSLTSPVGIALQIAMLLGLVALLRIDWRRVLTRGAGQTDVAERGVMTTGHAAVRRSADETLPSRTRPNGP